MAVRAGFEEVTLAGFSRLVQICAKLPKPPNWIIFTQHPLAQLLRNEFGKYHNLRYASISELHPRSSLIQLLELILGSRLKPPSELTLSELEDLTGIHRFFDWLGRKLIQDGYDLVILDHAQALNALKPELRMLGSILICQLSQLISVLLICSQRYDPGFYVKFRRFHVI